jgi:hypothetical protein
MIVVRDVLQIQPEHMKEVKSQVGAMRALEQRLGHPITRVMTDLTGEYYTLVLESEFPSLGAYEEIMKKTFADKEWQTQYGRMRPMVRGGRRELYQVLE